MFCPVRAQVALGLLLPVTLASVLLAQDGPESVIRGTKLFEKRVVVAGLNNPWEITYGPDGMIWVTERSSKRVLRVNPANGQKSVALTIDEAMAPGGQDGLLGLALHPDFGKAKGADYVYLYYTYADRQLGPDLRVTAEASPYRFLYGKVVRYSFDQAAGTLGSPQELVKGLPAGNDHNGGRLKVGPDRRLYLTIGDQGNNQLGNFCNPVLSQRLPTSEEIRTGNYASYEGKSLRLNLDGAIPPDNPKFAGVQSHIFTVGHRNIQGIDFGPTGALYAAEHGPKTDDEINVLKAGGNYGWPNVAGFRDGKAYEYARWAESTAPCSAIRFSDLAIHPSVPREPESAFRQPMENPLATMFTVDTGFNFQNPACRGVDYICWPTVGVSGVEYYGAKKGGIPGWERVLLVTTLKRGSLYVLPLRKDGKAAAGKFHRYFQSENRYRDTTVSPDGRTIFVATDSSGLAESATGGVTTNMADKGAILAFTYTGEGPANGPAPKAAAPVTVSKAAPGPDELPANAVPGDANAQPPAFSAKQVSDGNRSYDAYCAVCHGSTLTNGTFGTPLGGEYFQGKWNGKSVGAFFTKSKTMPPAAPASLPDAVYADIVAYILERNGFKAGEAAMPAKAEELQQMRIR